MTSPTNPATGGPAIRQGEPTYDQGDAGKSAQRSRNRIERNEETRWAADAASGAPERTQDYGGHHPDDTADPDDPVHRP